MEGIRKKGKDFFQFDFVMKTNIVIQKEIIERKILYLLLIFKNGNAVYE